LWHLLQDSISPKRILKIRKALGLTQEQLAEQLGAQRSTVARWELGNNEPRGANLKLLLELEKQAKK
jgi:DNA-binding transcriptional regulator YiaG